MWSFSEKNAKTLIKIKILDCCTQEAYLRVRSRPARSLGQKILNGALCPCARGKPSVIDIDQISEKLPLM